MLQSSLYVGLSGQIALQRRLDTIAHNVANTSTAGFRAEEVKFESLISQTSDQQVAFSSVGTPYLSRRSGEFVRTDNAFDVALQGDAWLSVSTPAGQVYTRDGRMKMLPTGELRSLAGYPILDPGGAALLLDPNGGPPAIGKDGSITQSNRQIGALGLFTIDPAARLTRFDNSGVIPDGGVGPVQDFATVGVEQGFVERANVNPVLEISRLIQVTRSFDALSASLDSTEGTFKEAVRTLGAPRS